MLAETQLPDRDHRAGVAISGGCDSTALLFLMLDRWDRSRLAAVHVNHGLRGDESEEDEQFCRRLAERAGVPFFVRRTLGAAAAGSGNLEETARQERLDFFRSLLDDGKLDAILTAHTRDDQAETLLFRLLRGTALTGMAGIHPKAPLGSGWLYRPLLDVPRAALLQMLQARGETWREDSTNASREFRRNRIRHELLPQLEREWNPELTNTLAQMARLAWDEEQFWESWTARGAAEIFHPQKGNTFTVEASKLIDRPVAESRRLVRWVLQAVRGDLRQIGFQHVEAVLDLARNPEGHGRVILPGADIMRSFEWLRFALYDPSTGADRLAARNQSVEIRIPGEATAPDGSLVRVEVVNDTVKASDDLSWGPEGLPGEVVLLRSWKPGDQYRPSGYGEPKKLKSLFQEFRVPLWDRGTWPIITVDGQIIWARQFGPAEEFRFVNGESSRPAPRLRITRIG